MPPAVLLKALLAATLFALPPSSGAAAAQDRLPVVATFSILADVVARVGGEAVTVTSLVPAGADVHVFQPGPHHARQLQAARLVVANGLGFEGWIDRLVRSSGYRGPVAIASRGVEPLQALHGDHGAGRGSHAGDADPHAWQSVPNMKRYVANIATALCDAQPGACSTFRANAASYLLLLDQLDCEIHAGLASIPPERRKVITSHRAFAYYAREYRVQLLAPVGISTDAEPSAAAVGRLIRQIREEKVDAFFVEGLSDPRLLERIRSETGGSVPATLYADGLSEADGPAATYEAMMRHNTRAIVAALSMPAEAPAAPR